MNISKEYKLFLEMVVMKNIVNNYLKNDKNLFYNIFKDKVYIKNNDKR